MKKPHFINKSQYVTLNIHRINCGIIGQHGPLLPELSLSSDPSRPLPDSPMMREGRTGATRPWLSLSPYRTCCVCPCPSPPPALPGRGGVRPATERNQRHCSFAERRVSRRLISQQRTRQYCTCQLRWPANRCNKKSKRTRVP